MLLHFATLLILTFLAATPPDECLGIILAPMDVATPIEVRVLMELLVAVLARLDADVDLTLATPELDDPGSHLVLLIGRRHQVLLAFNEVCLELVTLILQLFDLLSHLGNRFTTLQVVHGLFSLNSILCFDHLLHLVAKLISRFYHSEQALLQFMLLILKVLDQLVLLLDLELVLVFEILRI